MVKVYKWKPEMGDGVTPVSEIQESLRKDTDLFEDWYGYWDDQAQQIACELVQDAIVEGIEESYDDTLEAVYEMMDTNGCLEHILPNALFVYDTDELEILDYTVEDEYNEERKWLKERATEESCFTFEDVKEVILNSTYGGWGGVGIIVDTNEMARALRTAVDKPLEVAGIPVLYVRDGLNGSGHYVIGSSNQGCRILKFEKKSDIRLDYGKYSLGAVFDTDEWTWR